MVEQYVVFCIRLRFKVRSHFCVAEPSAAKFAIKLQQLLSNCSVATRWHALLSIH